MSTSLGTIAKSRAFWPVLTAILGLAAFLRFWHLASSPGTDWDESMYASIGDNMAKHDLLQAKAEAGTSGETYLYHPPFHFILLGLWFRLVGSGITQERYLTAIGGLLMLVVLGLWLRKFMSDGWVLFTVGLLAIDGWVVFTGRVGWFENLMMPLGIAALWLYHRAVSNPSTGKFIVAGLGLATVVIYKHIGALFLFAVLLTWVLLRKEKRGHIVLFATAAVTLGVYVLVMFSVYGRVFINDNTVQLRRITGQRESRGAVTNFDQIEESLKHQYNIYLVTVAILAVAVTVAFISYIRMALHKREFNDGQAILAGWTVATALTFAVSMLFLPHYLVMLIVPSFTALIASVEHGYKLTHPRDNRGQAIRARIATVMVACSAVILAFNMVAFQGRIVEDHGDAFKQVAAWTGKNLKSTDVAITEESIGNRIPIGYCKIAHPGACKPSAKNHGKGADYLITLNTITQQPPQTPLMDRLIKNSKKLAVFRDFKNTMTVYKLPVGWR